MEREGKGTKLTYLVSIRGLSGRVIQSASCRFYTKTIKDVANNYVDVAPTIIGDTLELTVDTTTLAPGRLYVDTTLTCTDGSKQVNVTDLHTLIESTR